MRVLFVSSGNRMMGISPIVKSQGESLRKTGVELKYYTFVGTGFFGYLKNVFPLRKYLKNNNFDVIHTHYSLSSIVASLAGSKNVVTSLMGSDIKSNCYIKIILFFFIHYIWKKTIVKSEDMKMSLGNSDIEVIPNGVDIDFFKPSEKLESQIILGWDKNKIHVLFPANPKRKVKNYSLALESISSICSDQIELHYLNNVSYFELPTYYNASDVILLTSLWEGSPNAIKESMACNRPIVSVDVGDVKILFENTNGCFICKHDLEEISNAILKAIEIKTSDGRKRIIDLSLDSNSVAIKLILLYNHVLLNV